MKIFIGYSVFYGDNPNDPIDTHELCTVMALRRGHFWQLDVSGCLYQLRLECEDPVISDVIKTQFYVDDMLNGGSTEEEEEEEASHIAN